MPRIMVRLSPDVASALLRVAETERRRPQEQAAYLLERQLTEQRPDTAREVADAIPR